MKKLLVLLLACSPAGALAQQYFCGEWSKHSISDAGDIIVQLTPESLVWSNSRKSNQAAFLKEEDLYKVFGDQASIYFVWPLDGRLEVRRVFATIYERPSADLHCN